MLGIEIQFTSHGRRLSLDDVAEMIAGKVANRITTMLEQQVTLQSKPRETRDPQLVSIGRAAELL